MPRGAGTLPRPTARALAAAACGVLLCLAASVLGREEVAVFAAFLILAPVLAWLYALALARWRLRHGTPAVSRWLHSIPAAGEPFEATLSFASLRHGAVTPLPTPAGMEQLPGMLPSRVQAEAGRELRYTATPPTRGAYLLGPYLAKDTDALGLISTSTPWGEPLLLRVGPGQAGAPLPEAALLGLRASLRSAGNSPDTMTRPYRDGDPVRRIHWPVTARQGKLMVRPDAPDEGSGSTVLLDRSAAHYPGAAVSIPLGAGANGASTDTFEAALRTANALLAAGADASGSHGGASPASLACFPAATQENHAATLALTVPEPAEPKAPGRQSDGAVIVTGLPLGTAAAWPRALTSRSVTVLVHLPEGAALPDAVATAWARAGWVWLNLLGPDREPAGRAS